MAEINSQKSDDTTSSSYGSSFGNSSYGSSGSSYSSGSDMGKTSETMLGNAEDMLSEGAQKAWTFIQSNWKPILGAVAVVGLGSALIATRFGRRRNILKALLGARMARRRKVGAALLGAAAVKRAGRRRKAGALLASRASRTAKRRRVGAAVAAKRIATKGARAVAPFIQGMTHASKSRGSSSRRSHVH